MVSAYLSDCRNSETNRFFAQNFTEIRHSATELWPETIFNTAAVCHLEFKKNLFGHVTVMAFQICCHVANFEISSKLDDSSLRRGHLAIFKMAPVRRIEF